MDAAIRPWRTATLVASAIALVELAGLVVAVLLLVGGPLARSIRHHAVAKAAAVAVRPLPKTRLVSAPAVARLPRARTRVLVLNGNGRTRAAGQEAVTLQTLGYRIGATGNARHTGYAASIVMYRPGYRPEARRLAHDAGIKLVGPLDGLRTADLKGSQLAVIVGT